ncbi:uncharacterized protein LOC120113533 [Hibiscus syriacus]|uniref:uncharacterized protein LOC120113533 n=1 Tax=Hibiscus syriacus TaxID=106335 RepID=UPI00192168F4|nr:uncharacterized protein LOC120113533 [Hibiscus syriacus]
MALKGCCSVAREKNQTNQLHDFVWCLKDGSFTKTNSGVVVVIGIDDGGGGEEQANQTDNEDDIRRCSSSCSNEAKSGTIDERGSSVSSLEVDLEAGTKLHLPINRKRVIFFF